MFYTDVKSSIVAGMEQTYINGGTKNNKLKKVGYKIVRLFFDTKEKDCLVGESAVKTVFFKR